MMPDHDVDKDGLLNEAEFLTFVRAYEEANKAKFGYAVVCSDEEYKEQYALFNSLVPDTNGLSQDDFDKVHLLRSLFRM